MHVNDVWLLILKPMMKVLGSPNNANALTFGARRMGRSRIPIHLYSVVFVVTLFA